MAQGSFASRKKKRKKRRLGTWNKKWQNLKEQIEKRQKQKQEICKDTKQKWGEVEAEGVDFCKEAEQMQGEKGKKKNKNLGNQSNHSVHKKKYLNKRANQTSLLAVTQQSPLWLFEKLLFPPLSLLKDLNFHVIPIITANHKVCLVESQPRISFMICSLHHFTLMCNIKNIILMFRWLPLNLCDHKKQVY